MEAVTNFAPPFSEHMNSRAAGPAWSAEAEIESAWDAAICAAQARCFDTNGKPRPACEIVDILSKLHTWHKEDPS